MTSKNLQKVGDKIGGAIWKGFRKVGTLFGINPFTHSIIRQAELSKHKIQQREKKAGIARNFNSPYDTDEYKKKQGGRRGGKKIQPVKPKPKNGKKKGKKK